ncbi:helix-turn-helix domain-containing protein [Rhizobium sp. XQZ8]|uniref:helix-turn-helix domain-containing protein n=1 Tax=Rhizobium populisoli TaxID=2859785 RepID=UPI001C683A6E|nr:helix-turn-helix domain-containing protein [Rhizobium populisoli]
MFGSKGSGPTPPAAGSSITYHEIVMQGRGHGYRMAVEGLWSLTPNCPRFWHCTVGRRTSPGVLYGALERGSSPGARPGRWLLMCHDRLRGDELYITHDFLGLVLAVRRPSVTTALHVLEGNGLIRSEGACVVIRDRPALLCFARDAHGKPEEVFPILFPLRPDRSSPD